MRPVLPALLLALLLAPVASAHLENQNQASTLEAGPYLVYLEPRPSPPFAGDMVTFSALISSAETGGLLHRVPATVLVAGPGGFSSRKEMQPDGTGYLLASMVIPNAGVHSVRVFVRNTTTNETSSADTEIEVFPNLPFRIRAVDQTQDVVTNTTTPIVVEVVDSISLSRKDAFADLDVRIERWTNDHRELLGTTDVEPTRTGAGLWRIEHRFDAAGMYHIRFASADGAFNYSEVPLLHVYVNEPPPAAKNEAPLPGILALAGALVLAGALRRRG